MRARHVPALALAAFALLQAGFPSRPAGRVDLDEAVAFVAAVEQAKGHLLASREVYRRGQRVRADVHASHPIQELGYRLWRPVTKVDPELGARVQGAFKEPGRAVAARVPSREYDAVVDRTLALLDRAVERVAPAPVRGDPRFQTQVIQALLVAIDEEYEEAVAEGRVVLEIEYQDAWGFFQRLRALWPPLRRQLSGPAAGTVATVDAQMGVLATAFASIDTPATPVAVDRVKGALDAIAAALRRSIG
jgi:hypothetical protein